MGIYEKKDFMGDTPPARIMGTEMEYLVTGEHANSAVDQIVSTGRELYGHSKNKEMLDNGARLHRDCGMVEYATPESLGPLQVTLAEMSGEALVKKAADGKVAADSQVYRRTGGPGEIELESVGYHQNLLTLRYDRESLQKLDARIIGSYAISRVIWAGAGFLNNRYTFSQKAHDIHSQDTKDSDIFPLGSHARRVKKQAKPILSWSTTDRSGIESHATGWNRLEIRYADAAHSPWARIVGIGSASLVLRILEHRHLFPKQDWRDLTLKNPGQDVFRASADVDLDEIFVMESGKTSTNLSLQHQLASMALELSETVALPEDELMVAYEWLQVCEDLAVAKGNLLEAAMHTRDRVEWAARLVLLNKKMQRTNTNVLGNANRELAGVDMMWDQLIPHAPARSYWEQRQPEFFAKHSAGIDELMTQPPRFTRAHLRTQILKKPYYLPIDCKWGVVQGPNGREFPLPDPYDYGN